jgi:polysaccharide export outer membrane protein
MLRIQVCDTPQLEQHPHVNDAGDIPLLFVGSVHVAGTTATQAATRVEAAMMAGGLMFHPQVTVAIEQYATQVITVLGEVNKPGPYTMQTPVSILSIVSMAGGLTNAASRNILVRRHGDRHMQVSFNLANEPSSDFVSDLTVYPGDTVIVPRVRLVYVLGDVGRPGGYPVANGDSPATLLSLFALAGAPNKSAVLSAVKLLRKTNVGYTVLPADLGRIERGKSPDITLQADDIVYIPFSYSKNFAINAAALATSATTAAVLLP